MPMGYLLSLAEMCLMSLPRTLSLLFPQLRNKQLDTPLHPHSLQRGLPGKYRTLHLTRPRSPTFRYLVNNTAPHVTSAIKRLLTRAINACIPSAPRRASPSAPPASRTVGRCTLPTIHC